MMLRVWFLRCRMYAVNLDRRQLEVDEVAGPLSFDESAATTGGMSRASWS